MIATLEGENEQLQKELETAANTLTKSKANKVQKQILEGSNELRQIKLEVEAEKEQQDKLKSDISTMQDEIVKQKKRQLGANGT